MFSRIEITFDDIGVFANGDSIQFTVDYVPPFPGIPPQTELKNWSFVSSRSGGFQVTSALSIGAQINNYLTASTIDMSGYSVTRVGDVIIIEAPAPTYEFSNFQIFTSTGGATAQIFNVPVTPVFTLTGSTLSQADETPCSLIKVTLTSEDGDSPYTWISPASNISGLSGDISRGTTPQTITIQENGGETDDISLSVPAGLTAANITTPVSIVTNPSNIDATVTVFIQNVDPSLTISYSIGLTAGSQNPPQASNVFPSVTNGDYTVVIYDQYGCTASQDITIDIAVAITRPVPFVSISKANSFRYVEDTATKPNGINVFHNFDNALSNDFTYARFNNPPYRQPWTTSDVVTTQIWTNYDTVSAELISENEGVANIPMTDEIKITNLGITDIRDCYIYDRGDDQTGIYFDKGNIYDPDNGIEIISENPLSGTVPEYGNVGQNINLSGTALDGTFQIKQVIRDDVFNDGTALDVLVIDRAYVDAVQDFLCKIEAIYDRKNYNVIEFDAEFVDGGFTQGCWYVQLTISDSLEDYDTHVFLSEPLIVYGTGTVEEGVKDLDYMEWSFGRADGINYSTGFVGKQRFQNLTRINDFTLNANTYPDSKGNTFQVSSNMVKLLKLDVVDIPVWVMEKLKLASGKPNLTIQGMSVTAEGSGFAEPDYEDKYMRVGFEGVFIVNGYEQYFSDTFDPFAQDILLLDDGEPLIINP